MHDTAFRIGKLAMNIYADLASASILEIGSLAVNGALRDNALPTTNYVGIDLEDGEGVDIVAEAGQPFPVEEDAFDLVMASSVFEHDPMFWVTFVEMCRKAKEGGYIYISAPSNGFVHRYPQDNWRFYPDAAQALVDWAVREGQHVSLVESFTAAREGDVWNDFVAVFRKGRIVTPMPSVFVHDHVKCWNVTTWQSKEIINPLDEPEDMVLFSDACARAEASERARGAALEAGDEATRQAAYLTDRHASLNQEIADTRQELEASLIDLKATRDNLVARSTEALQRQELIDTLRRDSAEREAAFELRITELEAVRANLSLRDSELRQRQEEIQQTRTELAKTLGERDALAAREEEMRSRLQSLKGVQRELAAREEELRQRGADLELARADLTGIKSEMQQLQQALDETVADLTKIGNERDEIGARAAHAESRCEQLSQNLAASESWVFELAGKQQASDRAAQHAGRRAEDELRKRARLEEEVARWRLRYEQQRSETAASLTSLKARDDETKIAGVRLAEAETAMERQEREAQAKLALISTRLERAEAAMEQQTSEAQAKVDEITDRLRATEADLTAQLVASERRLSDSEGHARELNNSVDARFKEIATLTFLLKEQEEVTEVALDHARWLRSVSERLMNQPRWWGVMPQTWRSRREEIWLQRSGLFDCKAYLAHNPDVAHAGMSPLRHYVLHGFNEGRSRTFEEQ